MSHCDGTSPWASRDVGRHAAGGIDTADVTLRWDFTFGIKVARKFARFSCRTIKELIDLALMLGSGMFRSPKTGSSRTLSTMRLYWPLISEVIFPGEDSAAVPGRFFSILISKYSRRDSSVICAA